ncbi:MAG: PssE/Cps14G family polysaccharide biosynthesis glycosyltransferase [Erysipelotrichaceae bacterium]|jgi:UDP-N-acetylglucosamine transferase subunit ALG13
MILVTLGTQDKSFVRLLEALEKQCENGLIQDEIIVQSGYTKFESKHMKLIPYFSQDELDQYRQNAQCIITHGGVGSILDGCRYEKKIIGVARLKEYKEHINDHQIEICEQFSKDGYILYAEKLEDIHRLIEQSKSFEPKKYIFDNKKLIMHIKSVIDFE